mmetsp:Transcript_32804/g.55315  ORF Transcript_32804/g.55315 Transcript_32804/m.55315 type:complete len:352 (-) Transcript_32804:976-2031(-)
MDFIENSKAAPTEAAVLRVVAIYKFCTIHNPDDMRNYVLNKCIEEKIRGSLLVAIEGINGTIAGSEHAIGVIMDFLQSIPEIGELEAKYSWNHGSDCFRHMKVKVKQEIVTMGHPGIDPTLSVGTYVDPVNWNDLIRRADVMVIDTRNKYETHIGKFTGAVDPGTETFREFPEWASKLVNSSIIPTENGIQDPTAPIRPKAIAMYCTGGIRCEKSTALMKSLGVEEVYHLKGGILKYLEEIPASESMWEGECFVFDHRVAVAHGLEAGQYIRCYACKMPLSEEDCNPDTINGSKYKKGIHCLHCIDAQTPKQRERFQRRQEQVLLAEKRGQSHIGQGLNWLSESKKEKNVV